MSVDQPDLDLEAGGLLDDDFGHAEEVILSSSPASTMLGLGNHGGAAAGSPRSPIFMLSIAKTGPFALFRFSALLLLLSFWLFFSFYLFPAFSCFPLISIIFTTTMKGNY
jgi:hypothetical protein